MNKAADNYNIYNNWKPPLVAGRYKIAAGLAVKDGDAIQPGIMPAELNFAVDTPQYTLSPGTVFDTYPKPLQAGRFDTTIPHIMFSRRTLCWERIIDQDHNDLPWLCLLLLDEQQMAATGGIWSCSINDLLKNTLRQVCNKEDKERADVIDMPAKVFDEVKPTVEELPYLAFVKQAAYSGPATAREIYETSDDGFFATLLCNRCPPAQAANGKYTMLLVSLESQAAVLTKPAEKNLRLVVLYNWEFYQQEGKSFQALSEALTVMPFKSTLVPQRNNVQFEKALNQGYSLRKHTTRTGAQMVAWYRGPLNPGFVPLEANPKIFHNADEALRMDDEDGLFDVSYATAWQLGRMLALSNKPFSTELYRWQAALKQTEKKMLLVDTLQQLMPGIRQQELYDLLNPASTQPALWENTAGNYLAAVAHTGSNEKQVIEKAKLLPFPPPPQAVQEWLYGLSLLNDVPYSYLLPDESYLPKEHLATFLVDNNWIEALLGGALSIAGQASDALVSAMREPVQQITGLAIAGNNGSVAKTNPFISGFVLRTELLKNWKGVRVQAEEKSNDREADGTPVGQPVEVLKLQRLADDTILCLLKKQAWRLRIEQPAETMHFAAGKYDKEGRWFKETKKGTEAWDHVKQAQQLTPSQILLDIYFDEK